MSARNNYPLCVIRDKGLSPTQKLFLLWCWCDRDNDERYDLFGKMQDSYLGHRNVKWYADLLGFFDVGTRAFVERFSELLNQEYIKVENEGTNVEVTFVDFSFYNVG